MNSLSWLLYFADVLPNIGRMFALVGWTLFAVLAVISFVFILAAEPQTKKYYKKISCGVLISLFLLLITAIIPSKNTIYAIAVSETGEKILQSEWGKRGGRAIDAWITKQLEESSSKSSK